MTGIWRGMGTGEKFGVVIVCAFVPSFLFMDLTVDEPGTSFVAIIAYLALLLCFGVAAVWWIFIGGNEHSGLIRNLADRFLPLAALVAVLCFVAIYADFKAAAFARDNAELLSGPPYPKAVIYAEGIPDGGTAIIASPDRDPTTFSARTAHALVGESIRDCDRLDERLWKCDFD